MDNTARVAVARRKGLSLIFESFRRLVFNFNFLFFPPPPPFLAGFFQLVYVRLLYIYLSWNENNLNFATNLWIIVKWKLLNCIIVRLCLRN